MKLKQQNNPFMWGFLVLSLLLHLLALQLLPGIDMTPITEPEKPVYVEIRPADQIIVRTVELDVEPDRNLDVPRDRPAKRSGPINQVVSVETAPQGDAFRDMRPDSPAPLTQEHEVAHTGVVQSGNPQPTLQPTPAPNSKKTTSEPESPTTQAGIDIPELPPVDFKSLLQLADSTAIATVGKEWQRARRDDIYEGEYLRLDMQNSIHSSFHYRFNNKLRAVWNYPTAAGALGQEGTVVLNISVNHDGSVAAVKVIRSSGYRLLDETAIAAVRRGAPYGNLSSYYREKTLDFSMGFIYVIEGYRRFTD